MVHKVFCCPTQPRCSLPCCTIAIIKEYNVKRHYTSKHSSQLNKIVGQARVDKIEHLKKSIEKQRCFYHLQEELRTGDNTEF